MNIQKSEQHLLLICTAQGGFRSFETTLGQSLFWILWLITGVEFNENFQKNDHREKRNLPIEIKGAGIFHSAGQKTTFGPITCHSWQDNGKNGHFFMEFWPIFDIFHRLRPYLCSKRGELGFLKQVKKYVKNRSFFHKKWPFLPLSCHEWQVMGPKQVFYSYLVPDLFLAGVNFFRYNAKNWQFTV